MTKAERRKRAREKKRTALREGAPQSVPEASPEAARALLTEPLIDGGFAGGRVEPFPATVSVDAVSDYITGPIAPRSHAAPMPRRSALSVAPAAPVDSAVPVGSAAPVGGASDRAELAAGDEEEDENSGEDDGDADADEDEDEDGPDSEGDEDDEDGEPLDEEDALFNLACAAVEEGDGLSWNELVTWMLAAEVDDPRLALVAALLVTEEDTAEVPKLTGARVLAALEQIDLGQMVAEARETVANAPREATESDEERQLVRASARELAEQAKQELESPKRAMAADKPVKASQLRSSRQGRTAR